MPMLTVKQVADQLQVTPLTVRRWLNAGKLQGIILSDSAGWRIEEDELKRFIDARRRPAEGRVDVNGH